METVNYVILTTGRSGSTFLCKLLTINNVFKSDNDFHCETFHKKKDKIKLKEAPTDYFNRIFEQYRITYKNEEIRGIKIVISQFNNLVKEIRNGSGNNKFKFQDIAKCMPPNTKYILLKRRNIKKQAISYLKATKGLGWEYEEISSRRLIIYHPSEIDLIINQLIHDKNMLGQFLTDNNIKPLTITYEELCIKHEETLRDIFNFLNIPLPSSLDLNTGYKRQYDRLNDQLLGEYELYRRFNKNRRKNEVLWPFIRNLI